MSDDNAGSAHELRVLILAPIGKDAALIAAALPADVPDFLVCADVHAVVAHARDGVGAVLIAEEALNGNYELLVDWVESQPPWSDPAILLLTRAGASSLAVGEALHRLGNVSLIERPVRVAALVSAVRTSLRARRRQYEVRRHMEEREAASRRKDQFLATLAHELRNPLAPIANCATLLRRMPSSAALAPICDILERQANQLIHLVDDLMDVSRITRGKIVLRMQPLDVADVLRTSIESLRPQLDAAQHTLEVELPAQSLVVSGDPVRLSQVFANLLSNAIKYTDPGGLIRIRARRDGERALVSVLDNGIGIPAESIDGVFDLFAQVDAYDIRARGGLGIGLTLSRSLVEMHGGTLSACSQGPGEGSCFDVALPLAAAMPDHAPAMLGLLRKPTIGPRRILIVDDNRDAADSLAILLGAQGATVRVAYDGESALEVVDGFVPEIAILDIGMPGMSGHDLARRLRQEPATTRCRLIALTGWGQPADRRHSEEAGFDHHLVKPVELAEIEALIAAQ